MPHTEKPSAAVLLQLRTDLNDGVYPPGEPLSISGLSARIGVSPTPVREALAHRR
ncbi:GntR family transcriptional regulator, partial [Phenylobacterium aquaticum]|uniref:GntR family transcriptional regulator n=1 Tax=Phenylobacterium aquaticum TaxID=1763816 RepID=UPI003AFB2F90